MSRVRNERLPSGLRRSSRNPHGYSGYCMSSAATRPCDELALSLQRYCPPFGLSPALTPKGAEEPPALARGAIYRERV